MVKSGHKILHEVFKDKQMIDICPSNINEGHKFEYDTESSGTDKSVFLCRCGKEQIEHEDAGTGA